MKKLKYLSQKEFAYLYSKVPRFCVDIVVMTNKGIVLTKRTIEPALGMWHFPGSTLLKDETLHNAVKRISKTELGLNVKIIKMLGINEYQFKNYSRQDIAVAFLVRPTVENFKLKIDENADEVGVFKTFPKNMIKQQIDFIREHKLLK